MNVEIIWQGTDITQHVIDYTRQHDICTGVGSLDLIVEGKTYYNFIPWNSIIIREEGVQVAKYNISSVERNAPQGTYIIAAQDNSKRLVDYFIAQQYTTEGITYTRYWIEQILSDCGIVSYSINTDSDGEPVTEGTQLGMQAAYDSIINLLQMSGWYMYFDGDGICQIGELDASKIPVHSFYSNDILQIKTTYSDKNLRNRVYVWGTFDELTNSWIAAKAETYLGWFRDDGEDYRSVVYQNSNILFYSTALSLAEEILSNFSSEVPEKEVQVIGAHPETVVGSFIKIGGLYGTGIGQVSSYIVNMNSEGLVTTYIVDRKCPRLFGRTDIRGEYIYIGTDTSGVYRKILKGGYWYPYNTNISTHNIKDLTAYKTLLSCVNNVGKLFYTNTGYWTQYVIPSGLVDSSPDTFGQVIDTTSGYFIASSTDRSYGATGGITAVFNTFPTSGFLYDEKFPIYPTSGNRAWIVGLTPTGTERYLHQIYYNASGNPNGLGGIVESGNIYDIGVLDVETNDIGKNIISIVTRDKKVWGNGSFGNYTTFGQTYDVVGRNIYNSFPPPNDGVFISASGYGGYITLNHTNIFTSSTIYTNPSGYYLASTQAYASLSQNTVIIVLESKVPIGGVQENTYYYITCSVDQHTLMNTSARRKLVKVSDSEYNIIIHNSPDDGQPILLKLNTSLGIVTEQINYPVIKKITQGPEMQIPDGFLNTTAIGGAGDGDYYIYAGIIHGDAVAYNGFGAVRVINVKTGGYVDYIVTTDQFYPDTYNGGYYYFELTGYDETPNHFIVAFNANMSGETTDMTVPRETKFWLFCINKYTGQVNHTETSYTWKFPNYIEAWDGHEWSVDSDSPDGGGMSSADVPRNRFFKCTYEDIDTGYGHAWINIGMKSDGKKWAWASSLFPPYVVWGCWYIGTYNETVLIDIHLPNASTLSTNSWRDDVEGNINLVPPWPASNTKGIPFQLYRTPSWLDNIISLYSRNTMPPVIFHTMRPPGYDEGKIGFINPFNILQGTYLFDNSYYYWHEGIQETVAYDMIFQKMLDDIDNTIYMVHPSGLDTLVGFDLGGNVTKLYDSAHHGGGLWGGTPIVLGNNVVLNDYSYQQFRYWPGSGINDLKKDYKILYHDPTIASGQFTEIFQYHRPLALETGYGLPTVIYDLPSSGQGEWQSDMPSTLIGVSYLNASGTFATQSPNFDIVDARVFDVFNNSNFPLQSGETLPENTLNRFIGAVNNKESLVMFNTELENLPTPYSRIITYSGYEISHVDFTNFIPSPYIFISIYSSASGEMFFQRNTEQNNFYSYSSNLPIGGRITIIRADDWI